MLVERGFRVLRFDNRDCGLSQKMDPLGRPHLLRTILRARLGLPAHVPYGLEDMALDATGRLDALGIRAAHVVGASMGGMIGQLLAARHPHRVLTLTSIMSSTGARYFRGEGASGDSCCGGLRIVGRRMRDGPPRAHVHGDRQPGVPHAARRDRARIRRSVEPAITRRVCCGR